MRAENLSWDDLRIFMHVARCENLSKAGKQLKVDQSTVSRRLNHLEYSLGFSLFERGNTGLQLNDQGTRLLAQVELMGAGFSGLLDELYTGTNEIAGRVRVGTMEGLASLYLTRQIPRLQALHPNVTLELVTSTHQLQVTRREADVFLGFFEPKGHGFHSERLASFELNLYASDDYIAQKGLPDAQNLAEHDFVGYVEELIEISAVRWLDDLIQKPNIVFYSNSMLSQMFAAAAGVGLVMLPSFSEAERFGLRKIELTTPAITRELWLSVHQDLRYIARIKTMTAYLTRLFKNDEHFRNA
ncbi:LysR family transcriptional regulator [Pseudomonas sp. SLFW]|uniref:LysR family transcriptional regulator n=1 Tax=Pseudomonas sp. SLFW TaxID=2683259 RepID=UPI001412515F|nr:LysR family transcriptional regulator [Pseudomonas sp. SLFW]NBB10113.1 LysR family transcriptional regulator [Pseudomonas sp. SLFW]